MQSGEATHVSIDLIEDPDSIEGITDLKNLEELELKGITIPTGDNLDWIITSFPKLVRLHISGESYSSVCVISSILDKMAHNKTLRDVSIDIKRLPIAMYESGYNGPIYRMKMVGYAVTKLLLCNETITSFRLRGQPIMSNGIPAILYKNTTLERLELSCFAADMAEFSDALIENKSLRYIRLPFFKQFAFDKLISALERNDVLQGLIICNGLICSLEEREELIKRDTMFDLYQECYDYRYITHNEYDLLKEACSRYGIDIIEM